MGLSGEEEVDGGGGGAWQRGFRSLVRRKKVNSVHDRTEGTQLAKHLSVVQLIAIGEHDLSLSLSLSVN